MNIYLFYTFEIGLLILVVLAIVYAFREATRPRETAPDPEDNESA